jgi:nucleoside-diphosphate-sugar epimerase
MDAAHGRRRHIIEGDLFYADVMARVVVTGSAGKIGSVLTEDAGPHGIVEFDLPEHDMLDLHGFVASCRGADVLVHLAGQFAAENIATDVIDPANVEMDLNAYRAAIQAGVPRVVVASSVHADQFYFHSGLEPLHPLRPHPVPTGPYGARKQMLEALGRHYSATAGLDVVAIRFGGVNRDDTIPDDPVEKAVRLTRADCRRVLLATIEAPVVPGRFSVLYAVSDNPERFHDLDNPFGWQPAADL